jgi:hypothetical protein
MGDGGSRLSKTCDLVRVTIHRGEGSDTSGVRPMTDGTNFIDPPLPSIDRHALEAEFARATETDVQNADRKDRAVLQKVRLCRAIVSGRFAAQSLRLADRIVLGRSADGGIRGLITVYGPAHLHPLTNQPYCRPHELYLDVVCSYACPGGCGAAMLDQFVRHLRKREPAVRALRLHSCASARTMWRDRFGFVEADTAVV